MIIRKDEAQEVKGAWEHAKKLIAEYVDTFEAPTKERVKRILAKTHPDTVEKKAIYDMIKFVRYDEGNR